MTANPQPDEILTPIYGQGTMMQAHTHRPQVADALEMQRWMSLISLQEFVSAISSLTDFIRERCDSRPRSAE